MDGKVTTAIVVNVDDILTDEQNIGGLETDLVRPRFILQD